MSGKHIQKRSLEDVDIVNNKTSYENSLKNQLYDDIISQNEH